MKGGQKEAAIHILRSKDVVAIFPTGFEESVLYQLHATVIEMQMERLMLLLSLFTTLKHDKIEEMKELRIPFIVVSKDGVLLLIAEAKYKLAF